MVSSGTFVFTEQTRHPSSGTSSSLPENRRPISLESIFPYNWYLGESTHPVLQVSPILWKMVQMRPEEMHFHSHACTNLAVILHYFINHLPIVGTSVVAKKVCNDGLKGQPGREFNRIPCIIKASVLDEFPYLGTIKYTCLNFLHAFLLKLLMEESQSSTFPVQCLYKVLHESEFDVEGESNILLCSTRGWDRALCDPGFNPCLDDHSCLLT